MVPLKTASGHHQRKTGDGSCLAVASVGGRVAVFHPGSVGNLWSDG